MQMNLKSKRNRYLLSGLLAIGVVVGTGAILQSQAAIPVHDWQATAKIIDQIKKATEQINHLKKQIDLQLQNLKSIQADKIDPIRKDIAIFRDEYTKLKNSMNSVISGTKEAKEAFKENFISFQELDLKRTTYQELSARTAGNRAMLEKSNMEITDLISQKQKELEKSQERIAKLTDELKNAPGEKALAQLQGYIAEETANSQAITGEINALRVKAEAIKSQVEKLEKDATESIMKKTGEDFNSAAKTLLNASGRRVDTLTPTFDRAAKERGWR